MTREEAIEVLQQDIPCENDTDLIEALEMAIKALSQEPILGKIRDEIEMYEADCILADDSKECKECDKIVFGSIYRIIDKYRKEQE